MITMKEMLIGNSIQDIPWAAIKRMEALLPKLNIIRQAYGKAMVPTNVYRTIQHHTDIYRTIAAKAGRPFSMLQVPMGSKHLTGDAADIGDATGELYKFVIDNPKVLEDAELFIELDTHGWVHFQQLPFRSYKPGGSRCFKA